MELYEALKNGTSKEDLIKAFTEELNAATAKLEEDVAKEEERKAKEKQIAEARVKAQDALNEYFKLCGLGDAKIELSSDTSDIYKMFKDIMKGFNNSFTLKSFDDDTNIIRQFLKTL